jgi:acetyl-CoA carboxylase biotin carboxyl carrier protein
MTGTNAPAEQARVLGALLAGTAITLLELTTPDGTIRLVRDGGAAPSQPAPRPAPDVTTVKSHAVGVFHHGHPLHSGALVQPGDIVRAGAPVGLLRVGPLLLSVTAPVGGIVQRHLVQDGTTVGYGTPLLLLQGNPIA